VRLRVLAVGKLKDRGLETLVADYQKRARKFLAIEVLEFRDQDSLRAKLGQKVVLCDERGETPDSTELSKWMGRWRNEGVRELDFAIGDAHGFNDADRRAADRVLALSALTFPHRLARLVLVEQLYRAGTILAGHPYHHA
jgi:23S rRNA (pseudouridine1915-N3)-methyltransferase